MINSNNINRYFNSNFVSNSSRNIRENSSNVLVHQVNRDETYSNKKIELEPYKFYQYSEGSIKSLKFPSESNLVTRNQKNLPQNLFQINDISKQLINWLKISISFNNQHVFFIIYVNKIPFHPIFSIFICFSSSSVQKNIARWSSSSLFRWDSWSLLYWWWSRFSKYCFVFLRWWLVWR